MRVLEIFRQITAIPHCSAHTTKLKDFITDFAKSCGFTAQTDEAGNILCFKSKRSICLQAHYDMVCVGKAPAIEIIDDGEYLRAKDSSLGADNGIGVAIMLALMEEGKEAEYLFTNDEEIGLIGAQYLAIPLQAKKMINLDSEEFGSIYIGCAGGGDIEASKEISYKRSNKRYFYEVTAKNFSGGHSGVDIDKNIPNAIKEFSFFARGSEIAYIKAGDRLNAIPASLQAKVASDRVLESNEHFLVKECEPCEVIDFDLLGLLCAFPVGVRGWEHRFTIPSRSLNLATVNIEEKLIKIGVSYRGNSQEDLEAMEQEALCNLRDFACRVSGKYPPWKPAITSFAKEIANIYRQYSDEVSFKAIHAGLECALFAKRLDEIVSIGPDIFNPHSTNERVRKASIEPIFKMLKELL